MRRRDVIAVLGGAALWPLAARAQLTANEMSVVGVLWHAGSAEQEDVYLSVLLKAFQDLGHVEGQNIRFEHRFPAEQPDRFVPLARELVEAKCDAIIAGTTLGTIALKKLTNSIPIVFVLTVDPVGAGFVDSLARPGGNLTGLSLMAIDLSGKRLGLLKEAVPKLSRVAFLVDRTDPLRERGIKVNQAAAAALGLSFMSAEIDEAEDIEPVFAKISRDGADGVAWATGSLMFVERARMCAAALGHKLPAVAAIAEEVPSGLLMSYGQDYPEFFRRAAALTDKISQRIKTCRSPRGTANAVQAGPQSQGCDDAWPYLSARTPCTCGRRVGIGVSQEVFLFGFRRTPHFPGRPFLSSGFCVLGGCIIHYPFNLSPWKRMMGWLPPKLVRGRCSTSTSRSWAIVVGFGASFCQRLDLSWSRRRRPRLVVRCY